MAKLGGVVSGFNPAEQPKPKPKPKPKLVPKNKKNSILRCAVCGYEEEYSFYRARKWLQDDGEQYCNGCMHFFGLADISGLFDHSLPSGYTTDSPEDVKAKIERIKETKFVFIKRTMRFGGAKTGVSVEVNFGDIFPTIRVGSDADSNGSSEAAFNASTVDVQFGPEVLTLYTHEIIPLEWLDVMQLRKDKIVIEAFLSKDCQGYFTPTEDGKELLINMFGDR